MCAIGKGLQRYYGGKSDEQPKEEKPLIYRKGIVYAVFKDDGNKVQDECRNQMRLAETKSFCETACKSRGVDGEASAGGASREQGDPVCKFGVCIDIPDTPVIRTEKEVWHCARKLVRRKWK